MIHRVTKGELQEEHEGATCELLLQRLALALPSVLTAVGFDQGLSTMWTADEIAWLCYEHYGSRLPKQGKPEPNREWTLLAAVVKIQPTADQACNCSDGPVQGETFSP